MGCRHSSPLPLSPPLSSPSPLLLHATSDAHIAPQQEAPSPSSSLPPSREVVQGCQDNDLLPPPTISTRVSQSSPQERTRTFSVRSSSLSPLLPPPSLFNNRDNMDYPHKNQFNYLGLFYLRDILSLFKVYQAIVLAENVLAIDDMDLENDGFGAREILLDKLLNSKESKENGPVKIKSILKHFHQQDNKFLRTVFTLHCEDKHNIVKNQITFKLFVYIVWNYCTQNINTFAEYVFGLYDTVHSGALPAAKFDRMIKVGELHDIYI
jgi:hypothetical protein